MLAAAIVAPAALAVLASFVERFVAWLIAGEFPIELRARKKFRDRATRAMRELRKEEATGDIRDGSGRRYRVGVFFLLAGDLEKAAAAFDWFDEKFPEDIGEPIFYLYGALAAYRQGDLLKARTRLANALLGNIYLLPLLIEERIDTSGIWHASNWGEASYLRGVAEFLNEPTSNERRWMAVEWNSTPFVALREGYLATYRALNQEQEFSRRGIILSKWEKVRAKCFAMLTREK